MLTFHAPAKINWFLSVYETRSDGFHNIESIIQKIGLYDVLNFRPSGEVVLVSDLDITVRENIVFKAAMVLKETYRVSDGAEIHLTKNIPVSAGLGGGSSDAAATLIALNTLWTLNLAREDLVCLAEKLGSDVPFFLDGPLALVQGRGERITPMTGSKPAHMLLVKPPLSISTDWAYRTLADSRQREGGAVLTKKTDKPDNIKFLAEAIGEARVRGVRGFANDLETVTVKHFPVIGEIKEKLEREGALFSLMSGSGSTVFGVFDSVEAAGRASRAFQHYWTAVVQTLTD